MKDGLRDVTPTCRIRIDKEGRWYYEGAQIVNPMVLKAFCDALTSDEDGRHCIVLGNEICYVEVEDTPFVVSCIRGDPETGLYIRLNTMDTFPLDPEKLSIGSDNVMYYTLPHGTKVRFSRQAYYSLAFMMEERDGSVVLRVKGRDHAVWPAG